MERADSFEIAAAMSRKRRVWSRPLQCHRLGPRGVPPRWRVYEKDVDGWRILAYKDGSRAGVHTRLLPLSRPVALKCRSQPSQTDAGIAVAFSSI
jgi:hypothetical protein